MAAATSRFDENKRAVDREIYGAGRQDGHDPLHPVHALRPLHAEEVAGVEEIGAIGRGENMEITSYLEQALSQRAVRQCRRSLPGRRAGLQALQLRGAALGAAQDPGDRRDGRGRHQHPPRRPPARGDARAAAASTRTSTRSGRTTRPATQSTACSATGSTGRGCAKAASCARRAGTRRSRRSPAAEGGGRRASRRSPATCVDVETMYAAKALLGALGSDLLEGRQTGLDYDVSSLAAVNFNTTIAGIETADVDPAGRHQPALGSAAGQHPHPQGGARRARRCSRSGRRSTSPTRSSGSATICRCSATCPRRRRMRSRARASGGDRRRRRAQGAGRAGGDAWRWPRRSTWSGTAGTASTSSTPRRRASAG